MDWFKVIVILLLGFLIIREFTRKKYVKIENMASTGVVGNATSTGIQEYADKIVITKPVEIKKDLFVGDNANKWHLRDNRLGLTGKFDLVPGFTPGSTANDNWIRLLKYNSLNAGDYFTDGGIASDRLWVGKESWLNNKANLPLKDIKCADENNGTCYTGLDGYILYKSDRDNSKMVGRYSAPGTSVACKNSSFFRDPHPGVKKSCYTKVL